MQQCSIPTDQSKIYPELTRIMDGGDIVNITCLTKLAVWYFNNGLKEVEVDENYLIEEKRFSRLLDKSPDVVQSGIYTCLGVHNDGRTFVAQAEVQVIGMQISYGGTFSKIFQG